MSLTVRSNLLRLFAYLLTFPSPSPILRRKHHFSHYSNSCWVNMSWWCQWVSDAIQPFHPQSPPCPPAVNLSQHQGLFQCGRSIAASASASVLPVNFQDWFPSGLTSLISLLSKGLSRVFSSTTIRKHQFFGPSFLHGPTFTSIHDYWKNRSFNYTDLCWQSNVSIF